MGICYQSKKPYLAILLIKPNANRETANMNERKGGCYFSEELKTCSLLPAALHLTAQQAADILKRDPRSENAKT